MRPEIDIATELDLILSTPIEAVPQLVRRLVCDRALSGAINRLNHDLTAAAESDLPHSVMGLSGFADA
jgi:hypothetical protein